MTLASNCTISKARCKPLGAEIGLPTRAAVAAGQAPPPDVLFRSGMEDYEAGRYKLAGQEFAEYVKFTPPLRLAKHNTT